MTTPGRTRKSIYEMCDKRSVHKSAMKTSEKLKVFNVSVSHFERISDCSFSESLFVFDVVYSTLFRHCLH